MSERKEIIQLSGLTILTGMALLANMLIVGFTYRYHNYQVVVEEKAQNIVMKELYRKEHLLKDEIIKIEGVHTWNDTAYIKTLGI